MAGLQLFSKIKEVVASALLLLLGHSGDRITSLYRKIPEGVSSRVGSGNDGSPLVQKEESTHICGQRASITAFFCDRHFPDVLPVVLDCRYCSSKSSRKRTKYCCKQCYKEPVPLCVVTCFRLYHTFPRV